MADAGPAPRPLEPADLVSGLGPALAQRPTGLMLAVSGGPDSMALLHLAACARALLPPLTVATVDHGLRNASATEAEGVVAAAARLGLPAMALRWDGPKPQRRVQERARDARYGLLADACGEAGASHLVTAHHRDDQAETVLLRLAAGSGPAGLAAMRALAALTPEVTLARPLLDIAKARLVATCHAAGLSFADDPSNADPRYARPRLRRVASLLASEGLGAARLARLAERAARAEDALAATEADLAAKLLRDEPPGAVTLDLGRLAALPEEWTVRLIARALGRIGGTARLERRERAATRLREAARQACPLTLTLGGAVMRLDAAGLLAMAPEGARQRGVHAPRSASASSLGNGGPGPYIAR